MEDKLCNSCKNKATKWCAKCKQVYYCSRECQVADWITHKKTCSSSPPPPPSPLPPPPPPSPLTSVPLSYGLRFSTEYHQEKPKLSQILAGPLVDLSVCEIPNKGRGLRTNTDIKKFTSFYLEDPIMAVKLETDPGTTYITNAVRLVKEGPKTEISANFLRELKHFYPKSLDDPLLDRVWDLAYKIREDKIKQTWSKEAQKDLQDAIQSNFKLLKLLLAKMRLNCFEGEMPTSKVLVLYKKACLTNHSCYPNCYYIVELIQGIPKFGLTAYRDIRKGEEITVSYMGALTNLAMEQRQNSIEGSYFFKCACERCIKEGSENYVIPPAKDVLLYTNGNVVPLGKAGGK